MQNASSPPTFVFVLASHEPSQYLDLTCAAHDFLKHNMPEADTVLLVDSRTSDLLDQERRDLSDRFARLIVDTHEEATAKAASRALKIRSRGLVRGDMVYLDLDALVIDRLDAIGVFEADAAIAADFGLNRTRFTDDDIWVREHRQLGWDMTPRHYNSGVIYARDTPAAHALFDTWWQGWQDYRATGRCVDQPALDQAIHRGLARVTELSPRYNAVFAVEARHVRRAAVLHFLVSNATLSTTVLDQILAEVREEGRVRPETIDHLRATRYPWRDPNLPRRQFYAGNFGHALRAAGARLVNSVLKRRAAS